MKRSKPLERRTPLEANEPLKRTTPLRQRNPERRARLHDEQFGPEAFQKWVRAQTCCVPDCGGWPPELAHVKSRGAGGTWEDIVPLCTRHHREQHDMGIASFQERYGFDMRVQAEDIQRRWEERC